MTYERHSLSAKFGDMPAAEFAELVEDVKINGVREAGYLYQSKVIDGWHRLQAALVAGTTMPLYDYKGSDPAGFVLSKNLHRRHLTPGRRAELVVECREWAPEGRPASQPVEKAETKTSSNELVSTPKATVAQMAAEAGTSEITVKRAKEKVDAKKAAAAGEAPKPPKTKKPSKDKRRIAELEQEVTVLKAGLKHAEEELAEALDQLQLVDAVADGTQEQLIKSLQADLKLAQHSRDDWMNKADGLNTTMELMKQKLNRYRRRFGEIDQRRQDFRAVAA